MKFRDLKKYITSTILCIRFPFLYPRNRFTGKYYNPDWYWRARQRYKSEMSHVRYDSNNGFKPIEEDMPIVRKAKRRVKFYGFLTYLNPFKLIPKFTELDAMDRGWRKAFGIQMCKEIKKALKEDNLLYKYRITQIKEKWGRLHWYDMYTTDKVRDIIDKYEKISFRTCIVCGEPATYLSKGWISPYCDNCISNNPSNYYRYNEGDEILDYLAY